MAEIGYLYSQILIDSSPSRRKNLAMIKKVKDNDSFHLYFREFSIRLSRKQLMELKEEIRRVANQVRANYFNDI